MEERPAVVAVVEHVIDADPARVWALVGDPSRLVEWAGYETVGYMGTELPGPGHKVFVGRRIFGRKLGRRSMQVEIERWDAGSGISCKIHHEPRQASFSIGISAEVRPGQPATRIRMRQAVAASGSTAALTRWWMTRSLEAMVRRIERAAS